MMTMIRLLEDLRFFIGAFFLLVGFLLTAAGLISPVVTAGQNLNLLVGVTFVVFGAGALALALKASR
jgi:hypothetical protein